MAQHASDLVAPKLSEALSGAAETRHVLAGDVAHQPAGRRFNLALFLELNGEYRSRPLMPAPRTGDPAENADRGANRAQELAETFGLKGKSVLEIGCGRGEVARTLAAGYGCRVVAIDIQRFPEWTESKGVDFFVADLTDGAPPSLGTFDFIYSSAVWEHVRHPYTMLKEAKRLLASDGVFRLSANLYRGPKASHRYREVYFPWPHLLFEEDVFEAFYQHIGMKPYRPAWVNRLTAAQYQRYFELLGLSVRKLWYSVTPLDRTFYQRFEDRLSRYPIFDLERDFIHVVLTHRRETQLEQLTEKNAEAERRLAASMEKERTLGKKVRRLEHQLGHQERISAAAQARAQQAQLHLREQQQRAQQAQLRLRQQRQRAQQAQLRLRQQEQGLRQELGRAVEKSLRSPLGILRLPVRIAKAYRRARRLAEQGPHSSIVE
jgi:SAM-dependent methyltransferase